jgi:molecular chaperone GrpE
MQDEKDNMDEMNDNTLEENQFVQEETTEPAEALEPSTDELKAQVVEFKDKYLRAMAEMDNMKKRQQRQYADVLKYGKETVLKDFLLVYDAIEKSIASAIELFPDDLHFITGLRMTEKLLLETLKKNGVEPIQTTNTAFDPNYHEALMQVMRDDLPSGMVADEIEKGFLLNDRVLRPAKVTVVS